VCAIASGLTFLEDGGQPLHHVLARRGMPATRINLAQSCNGVAGSSDPSWAALFFYSEERGGLNTGSQTLYIPYVVWRWEYRDRAHLLLRQRAGHQGEDDYRLDENGAETVAAPLADARIQRGLVYLLLWLNSGVLIFSCGMICGDLCRRSG